MAKKKDKDMPEPNVDALTGLEEQLAGTLRKVAPSTTTRHQMQKRIRVPEVRLLSTRVGDWRALVTIFGGVMSVSLLLITAARALFFFFRRMRSA